MIPCFVRLLILLLLQSGPETSFGVEFQPPAGWLPVEAPPLRAFAPQRPSGQVLLLTVWPAERLASPGDFDEWFARRLIGPGETVLQQDGPERRPANRLEVLTATQRVRIPQGGQIVRNALRLRGDGSVAWGGGSDATTLRGRYVLQGMTLVLTFVDGTSKPYTLFAAGRTSPLGLISFDGVVYSRR